MYIRNNANVTPEGPRRIGWKGSRTTRPSAAQAESPRKARERAWRRYTFGNPPRRKRRGYHRFAEKGRERPCFATNPNKFLAV